jgi:hypothetical protein
LMHDAGKSVFRLELLPLAFTAHHVWQPTRAPGGLSCGSAHSRAPLARVLLACVFRVRVRAQR